MPFPKHSCDLFHGWNSELSLGPMTGKVNSLLLQIQWKTTRMVEGLEHLACVERLRELGFFNLEKRIKLITASKCLQGCHEQTAKLFMVKCGVRMRDNWQNLKQSDL